VLTLNIPHETVERLTLALRRAGHREVGGILMAEHVGHNVFTVRDVTLHGMGGIARFVRRMEEALGGLHSFFARSSHEYTRFNYIGEWHSSAL
jgi:[CysO sulfur-carrier protein]-S-L-cysteine hydrolase